MDKYEQLEKLADLKTKGVLTEAEYETQKQKILSGNNDSFSGVPTKMIKVSDDQRHLLSFFNVHKIKNAENYGGWSKGSYMAISFFGILIPIIGVIFGIIGISNSVSEVKNMQGKVLLICSLSVAAFFTILTL